MRSKLSLSRSATLLATPRATAGVLVAGKQMQAFDGNSVYHCYPGCPCTVDIPPRVQRRQ